jgi:uncharacterized phage protein gp47/JayE
VAEEIIVKTRDENIALYKRSYKLRLPEADVRDGMQPDIQARCIADVATPIYANCKRLGRGLLLDGRSGDDLDEAGEQEGVQRLEAVGASGFVTISTGSSGAYAFEGDELTHEDTGIKYECARTQKYTDGSDVPVRAKEGETGPTTNQDAGVVLRWSAPRPGMNPNCVVVEQSDGSGLSGGRDKETDDDYSTRIVEARKHRATSGNDAEYQRQARETPGVSVEQVFTYPAILATGTTALVFTLKPEAVGQSRLPNAAQIAAVEEWLRGKFPADDGLVMSSLLGEDLTLQARIKWETSTVPWLDTVPWPPYYEIGGSPGAVEISASSVFTSATVICNGADYTNVVQPTVGANIAVYNPTKREFARKKILQISGTGPWTLTFDTAESATDTYVPSVGQLVMPWSESLQLLVAPVLKYVGGMGPGEQVSQDPGDGQRQMRSPPPKATEWPMQVGNRLETQMLVAGIADARVEYLDPTEASVGVQGVSSNLLQLADIALYKWSY